MSKHDLGAVLLLHISATAVAAVVGAGCVVVFIVAMAIALERGLAARLRFVLRIFALALCKRAMIKAFIITYAFVKLSPPVLFFVFFLMLYRKTVLRSIPKNNLHHHDQSLIIAIFILNTIHEHCTLFDGSPWCSTSFAH